MSHRSIRPFSCLGCLFLEATSFFDSAQAPSGASFARPVSDRRSRRCRSRNRRDEPTSAPRPESRRVEGSISGLVPLAAHFRSPVFAAFFDVCHVRFSNRYKNAWSESFHSGSFPAKASFCAVFLCAQMRKSSDDFAQELDFNK